MRCKNLAAQRQRFGAVVDRVIPFYHKTDALADEVADAFAKMDPGKGWEMLDAVLAHGAGKVRRVPRALRELCAQVEAVPRWVNWGRLDLGGATHVRTGITGGLVLACSALPLIYSSPVGNKPLVVTRKFVDKATRRLRETAGFVAATTAAGGLRCRATGWKYTVQVRVIHAQSRRVCRGARGRSVWDAGAWGEPLNQVDLAHTNLLFSVDHLHRLRRAGFRVSRQEAEAVVHLWRYSGHLLGIAPELLCATEAEGRRLLRLLQSPEGPPDNDAKELARALMETAIPDLLLARRRGAGAGPSWVTCYCYGLSHDLLGGKIARGLGYQPTRWRHAAGHLARAVITPLEIWRQLVPGAHGLALAVGKGRVGRRLATDPQSTRPDPN
jgi:hypothetical protein